MIMHICAYHVLPKFLLKCAVYYLIYYKCAHLLFFFPKQNKDFSKANYWQQQHQHQSRQTRSNTASGGGSSKHPPMWDPKKAHKINYDAKSAQDLLVKKKMPYLPTRDNHESDIASGLERSLTDHTAIDNMDEDNKFICQQCTNRKGIIHAWYLEQLP